MSRKSFVMLAGSALVLMAMATLAVPADARPPNATNFIAPLAGGQEVARIETDANGFATFQLNADGSIDFEVIVRNIDNVVAAHIHCGARNVNGPVGVTLFEGAPTSFDEAGTLAEGTLTATDPGNACGWSSLSETVSAMQTGNAYVNVHTLANPPGEIRGQILAIGPASP